MTYAYIANLEEINEIKMLYMDRVKAASAAIVAIEECLSEYPFNRMFTLKKRYNDDLVLGFGRVNHRLKKRIFAEYVSEKKCSKPEIVIKPLIESPCDVRLMAVRYLDDFVDTARKSLLAVTAEETV